MKNKKYKFLNKSTILFMCLILSVCLLGVGYAAWSNNVKTIVTITTGFLKPAFLLENDSIKFPEGELALCLSDDGNTLYIEGEVYSDFNEDIIIKIVDEGSIPSVLNDVDEDEGEVSSFEMREQSNIKSFEKEDLEYSINISPDNNFKNVKYNAYDVWDIEKQIENLKKEIELYNQKENYKFEYILSFEQDI